MRIVFIGTGEIGVPTLQALLRIKRARTRRCGYAAGQASRTRSAHRAAADQECVGRKQGPDSCNPHGSKIDEAIEEIRALQPDVIVVMAYGQILPRAVLEIPRIACLNLHASLLPRWRGAAPIQAAIAAGDRETGITVMYMD